MTISSTTSEVSYAGNGVTLAFDIPFVFDTSADLLIYEQVVSTGVVTQRTTGIVVSGGDGSTGTLTYSVAPPTGTNITILDNPERTQTHDYVENDPFPAESHEGALDKLTRLAKRLYQTSLKSLRVADGDAYTSMVLPTKVGRASKFLAFDANGNPIASAAVSDGDALLRAELIAGASSLVNSTGIKYAITDAETDAGVTPVNYYKDAGFTIRYGTNTTPGTTDMTAALNALANVCRAGNYVAYLPEETCFVSSSLDFSGITVRGTGPNNSINRPHIQASSAQFDVITSTGSSTFEDFYVHGGWDGVTTGQSGNIFSFSNGSGFAYVITIKNVKAQNAKRSLLYWKNGGYGAIRSFKGNAAGLHGLELFGADISHQCTTIEIDGQSTFSDTPNGYGSDITEGVMIGFNHVIMENTKGIRLNGGNHRALSFYKVYQENTIGSSFFTDNSSNGIGLTVVGCFGGNASMPYFTNWNNVTIAGNSNLLESAVPFGDRVVQSDSGELTTSTTGGVNFTGCTLALPPGTWQIHATMQTLNSSGATIVQAGIKITNTVGDSGLNTEVNSGFNEGSDECNSFGSSKDGRLHAYQIIQNLTSGSVNTYVRGYINISAGTIAYRAFATAVKLQ